MRRAVSHRKHRELVVGGLVPFSTTDYPGQLAAVVFCQGCPWRCRYCHNPELQPARAAPTPAWRDVAAFLDRRRGLLNAVVFSGGEPTLHEALAAAMREARAMEFRIGLHSAGIYPSRLARLLPLVDWVGLDIKAPFERYEHVTGIARSGEKALASAQLVLASGIEYEFRTTVHGALLSRKDVVDIACALAELGARRYAVQSFRSTGCVDMGLREARKAAESDALAPALSGMFEHFEWRNV